MFFSLISSCIFFKVYFVIKETLNRAQTTYAHQNDDGPDDGRDVQNFGMRPSPFNSQCQQRSRAGHRPETVVSCEIYLIAIWSSDQGERAGGVGNMDIVIEWPISVARRHFIKSPVCGAVTRKATSKPVYDNLTGLRMYGQRVLPA